AAEAEALITNGAISGGMIPKVDSALRAAAAGVPTLIGDSRQEGALRALLDRGEAEGPGTRIS
ncbi:MAG: hypothetical protein U1B78_05930, partial [Dehalococcoidia bacterium]|nr:hypothetical protein [Dehalococcoidia bacterium]